MFGNIKHQFIERFIFFTFVLKLKRVLIQNLKKKMAHLFRNFVMKFVD